MPSSASGQFPRGPHHVPDLGVLISRQFVHGITHLVVPTSLHRLLAAEYLLDDRPQRFGSVDHEQALLIGSESAFAQADQPLLSGAAFSMAPISIPRTRLSPARSAPTPLMT